MQMTRDFSLKIKALDQATGNFVGLASTYGGPPDLVGDIIEPGAYKQAIASQGNGFPLLWAHRQDEPIGIAKVSDSAAGLVMNGTLLMSDSGAQRAYNFMKAGVIKGISIGYSLPPESSGKVIYGSDGTRTLKEVMLHEVSIVACAANPRAVVTSVKSLAQVEHLLHGLKSGDVSGEVLRQLQGIDAALKTLLKKDDACACECDDCVAGNCADCADDCAECADCEGCITARADAADLETLKAFSLQLKKLTA
jgi:HK97 family phage prohead protease